jgi:hypothetical protein
MRDRFNADIPRLVVDAVGIVVAAHPAGRVLHLIDVGRGDENLREDRIGIERDRREKVLELIGRQPISCVARRRITGSPIIPGRRRPITVIRRGRTISIVGRRRSVAVIRWRRTIGIRVCLVRVLVRRRIFLIIAGVFLRRRRGDVELRTAQCQRRSQKRTGQDHCKRLFQFSIQVSVHVSPCNSIQVFTSAACS